MQVGDQREPVLLAVQRDQAGRVPGEVQDTEAGDLIALLERAGDLQRAAVPGGEQARDRRAAPTSSSRLRFQ